MLQTFLCARSGRNEKRDIVKMRRRARQAREGVE